MQRLRNVFLATLIVLFAAASSLSVTRAVSVTAIIEADQLNVRRAPGLTYAVIGSLMRNDEVPAVGRDASAAWIEVGTQFGDGWISAKFVTLAGGTLADLPITDANVIPFATISVFPAVAVHSGPSTDFPTIGIFFLGSTVTILGHDAKVNWLQVKTTQGSGWIQAQYAVISGDFSILPDTTANVAPIAKNVNYRVRVHATANVNSPTIGVLTYLQFVNIVGTNAKGTLWQVQGSFGTGWVDATLVYAYGNLGGVPVTG